MKFIILGIPFAKQSFRFTKKGIKYQTKEVKEKEKSVRQQIIEQLPLHFTPFNCPILVKELLFVFPPLRNFAQFKMKALERGETLFKITQPDLTDNLQKGLFDAMEGIVYQNDSQICEVRNVKKIYGLKPRIEVDIYGMPERRA